MSEYSGDSSADSNAESSSGSSVDSSVRITNKFSDLLKKEEKLGAGGFGSVYRCVHTLERKEYAVKRIALKNNKGQLEWYLREVRVLSCLEHKNVVRYYQSWTDVGWDGFSSHGGSQDDEIGEDDSEDPLYLFIQMEYCPRTLKSKLKEKPMSSQELLVYLYDLLEGLDYIHSCGYLHRDLSMKNIFFGKNGNIKIGDFGLAKQLIGPEDDMYCSQSPHSEPIGIGYHRAHELKEHQPYTQKTDLYGLGITYLEMLLVHIDTEHERHDIIEGIKNGVFPDGWENKFETTLLRQLLAKSPEARPPATKLMELISDKKEEGKNIRG